MTLGFSEEAKDCPKPRLGNLWILILGQGFKDYYSAIKVLTTRPRTPVFDPSVPTKVTTDSDTTAILSCKVHHLGNHTVSTYFWKSTFTFEMTSEEMFIEKKLLFFNP